MSDTSNPSLEELKKTYEKFTFIHSVLVQRTQFFVNEFEIAKEAAQLITNLANELSDKIQAALPPPVEEGQSNEQV